MRFSSKIFYASGSQAWRLNARADGKGGLMARGWYVDRPQAGTFGPFKSERQAEKFADRDA